MDKVRYGVIYKITNLVNEKCYVGQTTRKNPYSRFIDHIHNSKNEKPNMAIGWAIKEYCEQNFTFEVIDIAYNQDELNLLEGIYIKWFNSLAPNGYNIKEIIQGKGKSSEKTKEKLKIIQNKPENLLRASILGKNTRGKSRKNSSSKYCGVYYSKNIWMSNIFKNKRSSYLGSFLLEEDAAKAYDIAILQHYGVDSKLNFPELLDLYLKGEIKVNKRKNFEKRQKSKNKKSDSLIIGVTYCNTRKKWLVQITGFKRKRFNTKEESELYALECKKIQQSNKEVSL